MMLRTAALALACAFSCWPIAHCNKESHLRGSRPAAATLQDGDGPSSGAEGAPYYFPRKQDDRRIRTYIALIGAEHSLLSGAADQAIDQPMPAAGEWQENAERHQNLGGLAALVTEAEALLDDPRTLCKVAPLDLHDDVFKLARDVSDAMVPCKALLQLAMSGPVLGEEILSAEMAVAHQSLQVAVTDVRASDCHKKVESATPTAEPWYKNKSTDIVFNETALWLKIKSNVNCTMSTFSPMLEEWNAKVPQRKTWPPHVCTWNETWKDFQDECVEAFNTKMVYWKGTSCVVLYPSTQDEQVLALDLMIKYKLGYAPRCGNHDNLGLSTKINGVTIDSSAISWTKWAKDVNSSGGTVRVGSGTNLVKLYHDLWQSGKQLVPGGTCPGVGNVGLSTGGGYGMTTQNFGLLVDNVLEYKVWTPQAGILTTSADSHKDLFFACRGGRCANAAIVLETTLKTYPIDQVTVVTLLLPMEYAVDLTDHFFQQSLIIRPKWSWAVRWGSGPDSGFLAVTGQWNGPMDEYVREMMPYIVPAKYVDKVFSNDTLQLNYFQSVGYWAYGVSPTTIVDEYKKILMAAHATFSSGTTTTAYLYKPMNTSAIQDLLDVFHQSGPFLQGNQSTNIRFYPYNGVVHDSIGGETSFRHRSMFMEVQLMVYGSSYLNFPSQDQTQWNTWLNMGRDIVNAGLPSDMCKTYPNFPIYNVTDWQTSYYDEQTATRLRKVKAAYDPEDTWNNDQSWKPARPEL